MPEVREPKKRTSIETKQKILEKGFELICKKGYHHINCIDIANYAGVSTGSIYQYFSNKKDILISGMNKYLTEIMFPYPKNNTNKTKEEIILEFIEESLKNHKKYKIQHEELISIVHQDKELAKLYQEKELELTKEVANYLKENNIILENSLEKIHIMLSLIDNLSHELTYHHHKELQEQALITEVIKLINEILK